MVNILDDYFWTVFTVADIAELPSFGDKPSDNCLTTVVVLIDNVWSQLTILNSGKSGGPEERVVTPLYLIVKKPLEEKPLEDGKVPTPWKDALVIALYKKVISACPLTTDL